jgi:hypothetical protein
MIKQFRGIYPKFEQVRVQLVTLARLLEINNIHVNSAGQIAIQTNDVNQEGWHAGVGKSVDRSHTWELQFKDIQRELKDTPVDEYLKWLGVPVYRTRIMLAREKSSYSIHRDYSPRLHLPLVTNPQALFLFTEPASLHHMPADGTTYWVDTRRQHTFINGSTEDRLHLVMIVEE